MMKRRSFTIAGIMTILALTQVVFLPEGQALNQVADYEALPPLLAASGTTLDSVSSGAAAAVISNSLSGEGAVYQSVFYPAYNEEASWLGEVRAFLVDANGNMRADSNHNKRLDLLDDRIVEFDGEGLISLWRDVDGDGLLEKGAPDTQEAGGLAHDHDTVKHLWTSSAWLNEIDASDILVQRDPYNSHDPLQRYIFTFIDVDQDMVADVGEQKAFALPSPSALPGSAELTDEGTIYPYIQPYAPFQRPADVDTFSGVTDVFEDYLKHQTRRVIHYTRGADQGEYVSTTTPAYTLTPFRSRQVDYDMDGDVETWRLGDVIHSAPTVVGRPAENYDLLFHDLSYSVFYNTYGNRRTVVYVGGNDGMLHAFNGGFFDTQDKAYLTQPLDENRNPITSLTAHALGAELWAYVPYNLLPHLQWLTDPNYGHVYYCDLKPKVFDAKIFEVGVDPITGINHPNGWGTILVGGMRLGGGKIQADMNKMDGDVFISGTTASPVDRVMSSAFFVLDITDPESPPAVLAEFAFPGLGYTTCYPAAIPIRDRTIAEDAEGNITITFADPGAWYLVIGSGPYGPGGADRTALETATSAQSGKMYVVDLVQLGMRHELWTLDGNGMLQEGVQAYAALDTNAFVSDMVAVDYDLDYSADVIYFGTVQGSAGSWGGKLRRIVVNDDTHPANWTSDSTLIDFTTTPLGNGQPITAAPAVALGPNGNRWVFFGTGRFFSHPGDTQDMDRQSYYGIKEQADWSTVPRSDLLDVSAAVVYEDGNVVTGIGGVGSWGELLNEMNDDATRGWHLDFPSAGERSLGQATLLGDILTFTTYLPAPAAGNSVGQGHLYALYYLTGTAYITSVIGVQPGLDQQVEIMRRIPVGSGLAQSPTLHTGRGAGSKVFLQTSTGAIRVLEEANPGLTKSRRLSWEEEE
jgi:type IV pilus assembly protein PilY1